MSKNIDPSLRTIGSYLELDEDVSFVIPEYQRAYSWTIENCDKLWQDILNYDESDSKDNYFFGTIIISCEQHDTRLCLIDGQQRTTTFLLLLKALLICINTAIEKTRNDEDSETLCRGLRSCRRTIMKILYKAEAEDVTDDPKKDVDADICKYSNILNNLSINEDEAFKKDFARILRAVDFKEAESNVHQIKKKQRDNRYTNYFRNFKYFYGMAKELSPTQLKNVAKAVTQKCEIIEVKSWQVEQAINMFNSLNSDGMPLRDADIISAQLYAKANADGKSEKFNSLWKDLLHLTGELEKQRVATIDAILLQHMYYERAVRREIISDSGSIDVTTPGVRRYYKDINPGLLSQPIELSEKMFSLSRKWLKLTDNPLAQTLFKFNRNAKLFVASYLYRFDEDSISEDNMKVVLECMLRLFAILEVVDAGYSSRRFKTFLFGEEVKLVDPNISVDEIKEDFDNHIKTTWKRDDIKTALLECESQALVYLNELLFARDRKMAFCIGEKCDIEHIMPNSGKNLPVIREDAGFDSIEDFEEAVNKLGNKILLETKINRSAGNEWFRTKISTTLGEKTGYIDSTYPIAQKLVKSYHSKDKPNWTRRDIEEATELAAERIVKFIFGEE